MAKIISKGINFILKSVTGADIKEVAKSAEKLARDTYERHQKHQAELIALPDMRDTQVDEAKAHLESLGFVVHRVVQSPNTKYKQGTPNSVVAMMPKAGKYQSGQLIKLYYLTEDVIRESHKTAGLPDVRGMALDQASELLRNKGFLPLPIQLTPAKGLAQKPAGVVLSMAPMPTVLSKQLKRGSVVKLRYVTESVIEASLGLKIKATEDLAEAPKKLRQSISRVKNSLLPKKSIKKRLRRK